MNKFWRVIDEAWEGQQACILAKAPRSMIAPLTQQTYLAEPRAT
jgi:hypothetical protein